MKHLVMGVKGGSDDGDKVWLKNFEIPGTTVKKSLGSPLFGGSPAWPSCSIVSLWTTILFMIVATLFLFTFSSYLSSPVPARFVPGNYDQLSNCGTRDPIDNSNSHSGGVQKSGDPSASSSQRDPINNSSSQPAGIEKSGAVDHSAPSNRLSFSIPVQKLLHDLRQARREAEGVDGRSSKPFTEQDRERWAIDNPCRARLELPLLYKRRPVASDAPQNLQWEAVFEEYTQLHRTCMRKVSESKLIDLVRAETRIPGCKFATAESLFGLGNRITYVASVLLYAVLTQKVVLFPQNTSPSIMCQPFRGSSWTLPRELEHLNRREQKDWVNVGVFSNGTKKFLSWVDTSIANESSERASGTQSEDEHLFHAEADEGWHPVDRFFCDTEQKFMRNVEWVSAAGCLYFLPKLYAIPSFRPTLEALFPQPGFTLTYVLRSAFLPGDEAWDRIQRLYDMHLEKADRRVSIQSRYRFGHEQHKRLGAPVNKHITQCLHENGILPNVTKQFKSVLSRPPIVKVFITSLYKDLHDHLSEIYLRHSTVTGESVGLIQLTHDNEQRFAREVDIQALVEIILLSLSDDLLVTPLSTFGAVAQAYGGLRPWIVEFNDREEGSCVRSPAVDICYQGAHETLVCPYDGSVNGTSILDAAPYIQKCSPIDSDDGVVLVDS